MEITLYYTERTRAIKPRWLLEELQLPYQLQVIDIFSGEGMRKAYRQIHPHGQVPAVSINGKIMFESGAICHWLTDQYPASQLAPTQDDPRRMEYEQWMYYGPGTLEPPFMEKSMHSFLLPEKHRVAQIIPWATRQYKAVLKVLNKHMQGRDYLLGGDFSTADIMVGTNLIWSVKDLEDYPELLSYTHRLSERPAYQRANEKTT